LTNNLVQLEWAAIPGRLYQVQSSTLGPAQTRPQLSGSMKTLSSGFTLHVEAPTNLPYAIQVSTDFKVWTSAYTNLAGGRLDWLDPTAAQSAHRFYRTVALPAEAARLSASINGLSGSLTLHVDAPASLAYVIQVSSNLTVWSDVYTNLAGGKLDWLDPAAAQSARRFYRTMTSPAGAASPEAWTPVSDWLQASGSPMYYTTSTQQGVRVFRVQVRP
jgi:hypothetical protein